MKNGKFWIALVATSMTVLSMMLGYWASWAIVKDRAMKVDKVQEQVQEVKEEVQVLKTKVGYIDLRLNRIENFLYDYDGKPPRGGRSYDYGADFIMNEKKEAKDGWKVH